MSLPGSLVWRLFAVLMAALIVSQLMAVFLLREYVTKPRVLRGAGYFVNHLKTITSALETMNPDEEREFIRRIGSRDGVRIIPRSAASEMEPAPDGPILSEFRNRLHDEFGRETEVFVKKDDPEQLWVMLPMHGDMDYWVGFPRRRIDRDALTGFLLWSAVGLVIASTAAFALMRRISRPLERLSHAAELLGEGRNPPPLPEVGPTEFRAVARAFNRMKESLRKTERERAAFLAGVSHDLRTPLSHLRLEIEINHGKLDAESHEDMVADIDDMGAILEQFMDFAGTEADEPLSAVDLSELAGACAERIERTGGHVHCELASMPPMLLRPLAMRRLLDNLLANCVRHAGGECVVRTAMEGDFAVLSVLDRGPGIPPSMVDRLKEPFTRLDESRAGVSGAGLGLAIAERIVVLHSGRLELLPRDGGGLEARITLPAQRLRM